MKTVKCLILELSTDYVPDQWGDFDYKITIDDRTPWVEISEEDYIRIVEYSQGDGRGRYLVLTPVDSDQGCIYLLDRILKSEEENREIKKKAEEKRERDRKRAEKRKAEYAAKKKEKLLKQLAELEK